LEHLTHPSILSLFHSSTSSSSPINFLHPAPARDSTSTELCPEPCIEYRLRSADSSPAMQSMHTLRLGMSTPNLTSDASSTFSIAPANGAPLQSRSLQHHLHERSGKQRAATSRTRCAGRDAQYPCCKRAEYGACSQKICPSATEGVLYEELQRILASGVYRSPI
jgi:hypothetical protein